MPFSNIILGNKIQEIPEARLSVPARVLRIHHLLHRRHFHVHRQAMDSGDGDPPLLAVKRDPVQHALVPSVAQHFELIADVDLQGAVDHGDESPGIVGGVEDLEARRVLEEGGEAAVVGVGREAEGVPRLRAGRVAVDGDDLHALVEFGGEVCWAEP